MALNDRSGAAGVAWVLGRDKRDPVVEAVATRIAAEFAGGRTAVTPPRRSWPAKRRRVSRRSRAVGRRDAVTPPRFAA